METFIRTPDMPGVHQTADVSEVMPSDYELSPNISMKNERNYDYNTGSLLDVNPDLNAKRLHASYNTIIDVVNKCMERGAGIIWDSYQEFIKIKSGNPTKYAEALDEMESINRNSLFCAFTTRVNNLTKNKRTRDALVESDPDIDAPVADDAGTDEKFRYFYSAILGDNANADIPALLDKNGYLNSIAQLRYDIQTVKSNIKFDVENCIEYTVHRRDCFYPVQHLNSIAFKVKPFLEGISMSTGSSIYESIPVVNYKVCIDMHKLIVWMLSNCKMPDELPEALETSENVREEYIKSVMGEYTNFGEKIARRIVMELFDQYYNIYGNWDHFLQKFSMSYNKMIDDPSLTNLISKIQYFVDGGCINSPIIASEPAVGANITLLNKIIANINSKYNYDDSFTNELFAAISSNSASNKDEFILEQATVLFRKTFSVFFENAVLLNYYNEYQNEHYAKDIKLSGYTREFNKSYDIVDLMGKASTISDYNTRDFIQTIVGEVKHLKCMVYDPTKLNNGEYAFFMYSKFSREIWLKITNSVILASRLVGMMEQVKPRHNEVEVFEKVTKSMNRYVDDVYSNLFNMISEARFVPSKLGYIRGAYNTSPLHRLRSICEICNNYCKPVVSKDEHKFDELLRKKVSEDKVPNAVIDDGFIVSYDVSDSSLRDSYDLKHNFIMALKRRDILSLDF